MLCRAFTWDDEGFSDGIRLVRGDIVLGEGVLRDPTRVRIVSAIPDGLMPFAEVEGEGPKARITWHMNGKGAKCALLRIGQISSLEGVTFEMPRPDKEIALAVVVDREAETSWEERVLVVRRGDRIVCDFGSDRMVATFDGRKFVEG